MTEVSTMMQTRGVVIVAAAVAILVLLLVRPGSGDDVVPTEEPASDLTGWVVGGMDPYLTQRRAPEGAGVLSLATQTRTLQDAFPAHVATVVPETIDVYDGPGGDAEVGLALSNKTEHGMPQTLLITKELFVGGDTWFKVLLPVRPNGSTGWVRSADVVVAPVSYEVNVHLGEHRLDLIRDGEVAESFPVAIGRANAPTPGGTFYVTELLKPPERNSPYGSYAFILNGYSNVVKEFAGGDGVVGIHGTNDPGTIGQDVSLGCVRLENEAIEKLAGLLPLGTPINILP